MIGTSDSKTNATSVFISSMAMKGYIVDFYFWICSKRLASLKIRAFQNLWTNILSLSVQSSSRVCNKKYELGSEAEYVYDIVLR